MLTRLVDDLRTLAHTESGTPRTAEGVDRISGAPERRHRIVRGGSGRRAKVTLDVHAAPDLPLVEVDPLRHSRGADKPDLERLASHARGGRVSAGAAARLDAHRCQRQRHRVRHRARRICQKSSIAFTRDAGRAAPGLGSTIARNLVVAHGGEIRAESVEGEGTTMTLAPLTVA